MIFAVIDRETNNVLGEFDSRKGAEGLRQELVKRDPDAAGRVEIKKADLNRAPQRKLRRVPASEFDAARMF